MPCRACGLPLSSHNDPERCPGLPAEGVYTVAESDYDAAPRPAFTVTARPSGYAVVDTNPLLTELQRGRLTWIEEAGVGYFECEAPVYDKAYFDRYAALADTEMGRKLNAARVGLVRRHIGDVALSCGKAVLDVGIGSGAFIEAMRASGFRDVYGYDVNPAGVEWLKRRGCYRDLYRLVGNAITFWDSLEHIRDPKAALDRCSDWAFVSIPVFRDAQHVMTSRHYRKTEHFWYFTRKGFMDFTKSCGFQVVDITATETALGRDGIETFVLRRTP